MTLTADSLSIQVAKRLKLDPSSRLALQTMIPAALANLAKAYSKDPIKRNHLLTDPESITGTVTSSTISDRYKVDLSTLLSTNNVMLDALQYGTIWHTYALKTFTNANVDANAETITVTAHGFETGVKVRFSTSGTIVEDLNTTDDFYVIVVDANTLKFATTYANAIAGTPVVDLKGSMTGTATIKPEWVVAQWLKSPQQGGLGTCLPFTYPTLYLVGDDIYIQNETQGILRFAVPYTPTLATLPDDDDVEADLIDAMVALAMTGDPAINTLERNDS